MLLKLWRQFRRNPLNHNGVITGGMTVNNVEDKKKKDLLAAYDQVQKIFEQNNEHYFKRTQILMMVIQSALFLTFVKFLGSDGTKIGISNAPGGILLIVVSVLGILGSYAWMEMIKRQRQRLEFCRYYMRSIESKLGNLGMSLQYFTNERKVFHCRKPVHLGKYWERFPYKNSRHYEKIRGSVMDVEHGIACFLIILWSTILVATYCFMVYLMRKNPQTELKFILLIVMILLLSAYLALLLFALIKNLSRRLGGGPAS